MQLRDEETGAVGKSSKVRAGTKTDADRQAFLSSLGSWKDLNVDQFLKDNYESRSKSIRPPIELL